MSSNGHHASPSLKLPIYLDNHATTPLDPRVLDAMLPFLTSKFGNAASHSHSFGWEAQAAVAVARQQIASLIGATPQEIVFTSGATESNNLAIKGVVEGCTKKQPHVITVVTEHKAVLDTCKRLEKRGCRTTYLAVGLDGLIDLDQLKAAFTEDTVLVTVMAANNEIGVLQPVDKIGAICRERGVLFHSDAVQALGKVPVTVDQLQLDFASLTGHKLYGPKGCGALYVRKGREAQMEALTDGGGHERGMRSGTLNVPGIAGFGKACALAQAEMAAESKRVGGLRDRLKQRLCSEVSNVVINGSMEHRLPGNLNISFPGVDSQELQTGLSDVAVSSGSACRSDKAGPSYVLEALGASDGIAGSTLRFGIGRFNTEVEIDYAATRVVQLVNSLREVSLGK